MPPQQPQLLPQPHCHPILQLLMKSIIMDADRDTGTGTKEWDKIIHADSFATVALKKMPMEKKLKSHWNAIQPLDNVSIMPVRMVSKVRSFAVHTVPRGSSPSNDRPIFKFLGEKCQDPICAVDCGAEGVCVHKHQCVCTNLYTRVTGMLFYSGLSGQ